MKGEKRFVWQFIKWTTILNFLAIVGFTTAEAYVRWKLNQNFSFLGSFTLPALIALFGAQLFALLKAER